MAFGGKRASTAASGAAVSVSQSLSFPSTSVSTGDLVVITWAQQGSATNPTAVADNLGNTYTAQNAGTVAGTTTSGRTYYSRVTVTGNLTSLSVTNAASVANAFAASMVVYEGPVIAPPIDANPANNTGDVTSPFTAPSTPALSQAGEIVISWSANNSSLAWAASAPMSLAQAANRTSAQAVIGQQVVTATSSITQSFTGSVPTANVMGTFSVKAAPPLLTAEGTFSTELARGDWRGSRGRADYDYSYARGVPTPLYTAMLPSAPSGVELREDQTYELREDFVSYELRQTEPLDVFNQKNWPLPDRGALRATPDWVPSRNITLLTPFVQQPFYYQIYWPQPARAAPPHPDSYDWVWPSSIALLTATPVDNRPKNQFDWPLPQRPQPRPEQFGFVNYFELPLQEKLPTGRQSWSSPAAAKYVVPDWQQSINIPLVTSDNRPRNQYNWPLPQLPQSRMEQFGYQESFQLPLQQTLPTGLNSDWLGHNPVGPQSRLEQYGFQNFFDLALTSIRPTNQSDWPLPQRPQYRSPDWQQSTQIQLIPTVTVEPVWIRARTELPPRGPEKRLEQFGFQNYFELPLQDKLPPGKQFTTSAPLPQVGHLRPLLPQRREDVGFIIAQYDWPVPKGPQFRMEQYGFQNFFDLALTTLKPPIAPAQPLPPAGYPPRLEQFGFTDRFKLPLTSIRPVNQYDWPLPKGPQFRTPDWQQSTNLPLVTAADPYPLPKRNYDWPVPRGPEKRLEQFGFTNSFDLPLTSIRPTNQYDWPLPKGATFRTPDWQQSTNIPLLTTAPAIEPVWIRASTALPPLGPPFYKRDVPVGRRRAEFSRPPILPAQPLPERGYQPRLEQFGFVDFFKLPLTSIRPTNQYDWPVPRGYPPRLEQFGFTDTFKLPLTTHRPRNQYDWPHPVRAKLSGPDQYSLTQRNPNLTPLTLDQMPKNRVAWPNPVLPRIAPPSQYSFVSLKPQVIPQPPGPPLGIRRAQPNPVLAKVGHPATWTNTNAPYFFQLQPGETLRNSIVRLRDTKNEAGRIRSLTNMVVRLRDLERQ